MIPFRVDLTGKVAVVTGGSGVLGGVFCEALAACGAKVAVVGRSQDKMDRVVRKIAEKGGISIGVQADVLDRDQLVEAKDRINREWGTVDILINAAGGNHPAGTTTKEYLFPEDLSEGAEDIITFFDLKQEGVQHVFDLNFLGTLLPTQVFLRDMVGKQDGVVINISSMNAFTPLTKVPAYSGAKAAVTNFTQWLAVHLSKMRIRVNAIAPGFFLTDQNRSLLLKADGTWTDRAEKILARTPMGRFGEKEELVGTLLWLVDPKASGFVTGIVVPVDGGFSAFSGV